ncbi:MAG: hypothetical protein VX341_02700 [Bdellovibrionota bacterium]|nr:hypothetical protein [Bdellovibrionota bacterium]
MILMKVICLILLSFLTSLSFASGPRVVLMSSLKTPRVWYRSSDWKIEKSLEKIFNRAFEDTSYEIVIKEKASPKDLRSELQNPNNIAIFWVSHASAFQSDLPGVSSEGKVLDVELNNVADLFKDIHPNQRFLALIGCEASELLKRFDRSGFYSLHKNFKYTSFSRKIDARSGLKKAILESEDILGMLETKPRRVGRRRSFYKIPKVVEEHKYIESFIESKTCDFPIEGIELFLTRESENAMSASQVLLNGELIHFFDETNMGRKQFAKVVVSKKSLRKPLKLTLNSMKDFSLERQNLGLLTIESDRLMGNWKLFQDRIQRPIGLTKNLYRYQGEISQFYDQFFKYRCQ